MKLKLETVLLVGGLLLSAVAIFTIVKKHVGTHGPVSNESQFTPRKVHGGPCPGETKTLKESDPYMRGIIEQGQEFKVVLNYYDCNPIKDGDYVLYSLSPNMDPFVKIVRGVEGDHFKLAKDKKHKAWNLLINDEMVVNETDKQPYFFGAETPPTLSLYEKNHKGVLHANEVILLSSWAPGDNDSSIYGIASIIDVLGKVTPLESTAKADVPETKPAEAKSEVEPVKPAKSEAKAPQSDAKPAKPSAKGAKRKTGK